VRNSSTTCARARKRKRKRNRLAVVGGREESPKQINEKGRERKRQTDQEKDQTSKATVTNHLNPNTWLFCPSDSDCPLIAYVNCPCTHPVPPHCSDVDSVDWPTAAVMRHCCWCRWGCCCCYPRGRCCVGTRVHRHLYARIKEMGSGRGKVERAGANGSQTHFSHTPCTHDTFHCYCCNSVL
jgi:hypothetical protein